MKIGLIGFEFKSPNKGCEALTYSFLSLIEKIADTKELIIYNFCGCELGNIPQYYSQIQFINVKPKLKDIQFKYLRALRKCDVIFDVTMGDSFSDIYSIDYYNHLIREKRIADFLCKYYILLPQTYGPFKNETSERKAKKVFCRAYKIYCRDELSQKLLEEKFEISNSELASDMAFVLPFDKSRYQLADTKKIRIGINVSGLLYKGGFQSKNQFGLSLNYKEYIEKTISFYCYNDKYEVYLIPHVIDLKENSYDDDYKTCAKLHDIFNDTILAPAFNTPIDAKSYISNMDVFIGSRMHSTIASFSSNVVTIPVSYSRKFEGLFNSIDYRYVINGKEETTESAFNKTIEYVDNLEELKNVQSNSLRIIEKKNKIFINSLSRVIQDIKIRI